MPRLTSDTWGTVRAERETGATISALAEKFGVSRKAIQKRIESEGWGDGLDVGQTVRRKVAEKVAGLVAPCDPKKKAEAITAEAEKGAAIIVRHRRDWEEHHNRFTVHGVANDFDLGKSAKICAEMLAIRQKAERAAHGLDDAPESVVVIDRGYGSK